jgi:tRNA 2-selenouridine synthase
MYVKTGRQEAVEFGQSIAEKKEQAYLEQAKIVASNGRLFIYCWRGGLRSEKIAAFYAQAGYQVSVLEGGYKAYRCFIRQQFAEKRQIYLLGGPTGSGKTALLHEISNFGYQAIDLEALANHKGSLFGHLGQAEQPTTEQFENDLFQLWVSTDCCRPLWLEHESLSIGSVFLPDTFFQNMLKGTLILLQLPFEYRIDRLVAEYALYPKSELQQAIQNLGVYMGGTRMNQALQALQRDDFRLVAAVCLGYYDKAYEEALHRRPVAKVVRLNLKPKPISLQAEAVLKELNRLP